MSNKKEIVPTHSPPVTDLYEFENPVRKIAGIWHLEIPPQAITTTIVPPFHLLHYIINGEYSAIISETEHRLKKGDVVYYRASEKVTAINRNSAPVEFYSIAFSAPALVSSIRSCRVRHNQHALRSIFKEMHIGLAGSSEYTAINMHANLLGLLARLAPIDQQGTAPLNTPWHRAERMIKAEHLFRVRLPELCKRVGASPSTLHRSCMTFCGISPARRLQQIRMEEARGLLLFTQLRITAIAEQLGYPRIHDFSREAKAYYGRSPSQIRQHEFVV